MKKSFYVELGPSIWTLQSGYQTSSIRSGARFQIEGDGSEVSPNNTGFSSFAFSPYDTSTATSEMSPHVPCAMMPPPNRDPHILLLPCTSKPDVHVHVHVHVTCLVKSKKQNLSSSLKKHEATNNLTVTKVPNWEF
jgi:hypothetical protein